MTTSTTALMPLDPAVSPEQVNRILPIRANLLPDEITAGRNARRIRFVLIAAVVLVVVVMGGWYLFAAKERNLALDDANSTDQQVSTVRNQTKKKEYADVSNAIDTTKELNSDLNGTLAQDLPWNTLLDQVRHTATGKEVAITAIQATLTDTDTQTQTASAAVTTVGTLQITGTAADKKTIADFVDALPTMKSGKVYPVTNAYLTAASAQGDNWTFTLTAEITKDALCGRFTTACATGGY
jgi:cytoskeletal protein RodZ